MKAQAGQMLPLTWATICAGSLTGRLQRFQMIGMKASPAGVILSNPYFVGMEEGGKSQ